jgi:hypothetical protein
MRKTDHVVRADPLVRAIARWVVIDHHDGYAVEHQWGVRTVGDLVALVPELMPEAAAETVEGVAEALLDAAGRFDTRHRQEVRVSVEDYEIVVQFAAVGTRRSTEPNAPLRREGSRRERVRVRARDRSPARRVRCASGSRGSPGRPSSDSDPHLVGSRR